VFGLVCIPRRPYPRNKPEIPASTAITIHPVVFDSLGVELAAVSVGGTVGISPQPSGRSQALSVGGGSVSHAPSLPGASCGSQVGSTDGDSEGVSDGEDDGETLGSTEGETLGSTLGSTEAVGELVDSVAVTMTGKANRARTVSNRMKRFMWFLSTSSVA
jgi:hypothetical protein